MYLFVVSYAEKFKRTKYTQTVWVNRSALQLNRPSKSVIYKDRHNADKKTHSPNNALPGQFYFWHPTFQNYHSLFFLLLQFPSFLFCSVKTLHTIFSHGLWLFFFHLCFSDFMISLSFIITNQTILLLWEQMTVFKLIKTADSDQKAVGLSPCRRIFFSRVNFLCWLLFQYPFPPVLPQQHVKDPGHFAKRAGGRLHLNTHGQVIWTGTHGASVGTPHTGHAQGPLKWIPLCVKSGGHRTRIKS